MSKKVSEQTAQAVQSPQIEVTNSEINNSPMRELKNAIEGAKLPTAKSEERKIQSLQKVEAQKATASELVSLMKVEELTKKQLMDLFKVHKVVICLEKSGCHYNYKGADLHFKVESVNNIIAYFEGATPEGLTKLQQIAKEVKGSPKYLRVINSNGKSANLGSVAKFKSINEMFAMLDKIKTFDGQKLINIPATTKVAYVMEQFMLSREKGLKALEAELSARDSK